MGPLTPDFAQPVTGWRVWLVGESRDGLRLLSLLEHETVWTPGQALVARCLERPLRFLRRRRGDEAAHAAPAERCGCGIYAAGRFELAAGYLCPWHSELRPPLVHRVIGRVSLWGSVVECEHGWRASCAYPASLYVPSTSIAGAAVGELGRIVDGLGAYGVPVEMLSGDASAALTEQCRL